MSSAMLTTAPPMFTRSAGVTAVPAHRHVLSAARPPSRLDRSDRAANPREDSRPARAEHDRVDRAGDEDDGHDGEDDGVIAGPAAVR